MVIVSPIWDLKFPFGKIKPDWGLLISESGKAEEKNKSPIPNAEKYPQLDILNNQSGILYQTGNFFC